jgi:integrase
MSNQRIPSYRCKRANGRKYGVVSLPDGLGARKDILLGRYGTQESKAEYSRVIGEWLAADRCLPHDQSTPDLTINEMMARYLPFAERHYRYPDGTPSKELEDVKYSLKPLKELYGHTRANQFGPLSLKAIREHLVRQPVTRKVKVADPVTGNVTWQEKIIRAGLSRGLINQRIGRIRRLFKWAVSEELIPETVYRALLTVNGLQRGRTAARETKPVRPVSVALVEDTLPYVSPAIADMLRLLLWTGARSGEICIMRSCDIDTSGEIWLYRPQTHKTEHRGFGRVIPLGPNAKEIIKRHLKVSVEAYLFSPRDAMEAIRKKQRQERKTKVQPSQQNRKKARPQRLLGNRYHPRVLAHAVRAACAKHGLERWHPHQLRHSKGTEIRRQFGLDHARAALGQHSPQVAELYAELDLAKAVEVARKLG